MIDIENLCFSYKTYKKRQGLKGSIKDFFKRDIILAKTIKNISLNVSKGEIIGLLGKNGAGKTTLIKLLVGLIYPQSGKIKVMNMNPYDKKKAFLKQIGLVLGQKSQLIWDLPPSETLHMLKDVYGISNNEYEAYVDELLKLFDIENKYDVPVRKLSLGERMKFEIMASVLHKPKLLFLDEPTIGLDINTQKLIHNFLKKLNTKYKTTIILTSHYMKDIEKLADRIVILDNGQICCDMSLNQLLEMYREEEIVIIETKSNEVCLSIDSQISKVGDGIFEVFVKGGITTSLIKQIASEVDDLLSITTKKIPLEDIVFEVFANGMKNGVKASDKG